MRTSAIVNPPNAKPSATAMPAKTGTNCATAAAEAMTHSETTNRDVNHGNEAVTCLRTARALTRLRRRFRRSGLRLRLFWYRYCMQHPLDDRFWGDAFYFGFRTDEQSMREDDGS